MFVNRNDRNHHAVFGKMLAFADHHFLDFLERSRINQNAACRDRIAPAHAVFCEFDILAVFDEQDFENRASAVETFRSSRPAVVLLDLGLPPKPGSPEEGLAALSEILALDRLAKVIVITGQSEKEIALQAVGAGAYDFLCKPIEMEELKGQGLRDYARVCGELLAKGHSRAGNSAALAGYLGASDKMDKAVTKFAFAYADQTDRDHAQLRGAIRAGKVQAVKEP